MILIVKFFKYIPRVQPPLSFVYPDDKISSIIVQ